MEVERGRSRSRRKSLGWGRDSLALDGAKALPSFWPPAFSLIRRQHGGPMRRSPQRCSEAPNMRKHCTNCSRRQPAVCSTASCFPPRPHAAGVETSRWSKLVCLKGSLFACRRPAPLAVLESLRAPSRPPSISVVDFSILSFDMSQSFGWGRDCRQAHSCWACPVRDGRPAS